MVSSELIRRDPEWVTNDASGIKFTASHEDAAQNHLTRSPMLPGEPWRESQWRQAIQEIVGGITRLPHLRRHHHDVRDLVGLPAVCRSYYQTVEEILDLMYKYLEIGQHHGDRNRHSWIPHMMENLRRRENPLLLIICRGEEHQFLRDSRMFLDSLRYHASSFTDADVSFLQRFCNGNIPEQVESALVLAVDCIVVDAEYRHTGAEPLSVRHIENVFSETQMLYFHFSPKSSLQARQESRIEELEATVNNMLTVEDDLRAQDARLLDSLHRAEQQAEIAENDLGAERTLRQQAEATLDNLFTVEDDLRAQNVRLLDSLSTAEQQSEIAENELEAERTLRQQAEASRGRAVRQAEHRLRDAYARQHDEWYHDIYNYREDREQYGPAFQHSVEAPGRASGDKPSWLNLRRETSWLVTDLEVANNAQANLRADLSRVTRQHNDTLRERDNLLRGRDALHRERDNLEGQRNHAIRERNNLQGQLHHAQAYRNPHALQERDYLQGQLRHAQVYYNPYYHQIRRPHPR